jgi:adenosylhomocysteine nucleosidase
MPLELRPLVRALALRPSALGGARVHTGRSGALELTAILTGIGMRAAAAACERMLEGFAFDRALVVGIAGGVAPGAALGELIVPERVLDAASGRSYRPAPLASGPARGTLRTSDELLSDPGELARLAAEGVVALDMETAAIAAVCERHGRPWSVLRAISDLAGETPPEVLGLAGPDGAGNLAALARYLAPAPWRAFGLARLARDSARAARTAAQAAARACGAGTPERR